MSHDLASRPSASSLASPRLPSPAVKPEPPVSLDFPYVFSSCLGIGGLLESHEEESETSMAGAASPTTATGSSEEATAVAGASTTVGVR